MDCSTFWWPRHRFRRRHLDVHYPVNFRGFRSSNPSAPAAQILCPPAELVLEVSDVLNHNDLPQLHQSSLWVILSPGQPLSFNGSSVLS
mmetsp:Transcript_65175/g.155609  ORF Transcript_65175/g.155609 Transcript_65175/m.155609 type:complete len:89 (-) Transcript_65175:1-267(-)